MMRSAVVAALLALGVLGVPAGAAAQTAAAKPAGKPVAKVASKPQASSYPAVPAGAGYRFAPLPGWVRPVPAATSASAVAHAGAKARRELLVDMQVQLGSKDAQTFIRVHNTALDSSTLREVSEPQISFNPAYQTLVIHSPMY
eukprot:Opistho-2@94085